MTNLRRKIAARNFCNFSFIFIFVGIFFQNPFNRLLNFFAQPFFVNFFLNFFLELFFELFFELFSWSFFWPFWNFFLSKIVQEKISKKSKKGDEKVKKKVFRFELFFWFFFQLFSWTFDELFRIFFNFRLNENLNRGMVGSAVYLSLKLSPKSVNRASFRADVLSRLPKRDHEDIPLEPVINSVPIFALPSGTCLESWDPEIVGSINSQPEFSTFVLTTETSEKIYGASLVFLERFDNWKLSDLMKRRNGFLYWKFENIFVVKTCRKRKKFEKYQLHFFSKLWYYFFGISFFRNHSYFSTFYQKKRKSESL